MDKTSKLHKEKKFQDAYDLLLPYVDMIRNGEIPQYSEGKKTYNFYQFFEFLLYCNLCPQEKGEDFIDYESPISEVLLCFGSILYDLQRYNEAVDVLALARQKEIKQILIDNGFDFSNYEELTPIPLPM